MQRTAFFWASQLAQIVLRLRTNQLMYDGHHFTTKKLKNLSKSSKKFLLHIIERLRENISSFMGQKRRSKSTKKFLAKKNWDTCR